MAETGARKKGLHPVQALLRRLFAMESAAKATKGSRRRLVGSIVLFLLVPLLVGMVMYVSMIKTVHTYMEDQVTAQADILKRLASKRLSVRLEELERVAAYFDDGRIAEADMGAAAEGLLENPSQIGSGILRLDGSAVSGKSLHLADYPAVSNAFRGNGSTRYRRGEGLVFTAPIYNGENIKYVLYEFFDENELFQGFSDDCFDGQARLMLADSAQQIVIPISGEPLLETDPAFLRSEVQDAIQEVTKELALTATATIYLKTNGSEYFVFVTDLDQANMYMVGVVPHEVVANGLSLLSGGVLAVFALLLLLLLIGTLRVISYDARARESDELRKAKREVEQAYESKSRFLANMSHELRTPINTIMGLNEMVLRESREVDTRERAMDVRSASQILLGLINDVLDFSKIESGMLTLVPAQYSLPGLLRDLSLLSENRARSKSLDFRMNIQPDLPVGLYGDEIRLRQIMTNLLTNAIKYTSEGSVTMDVTGTRLDDDQIVIRFQVTDTGIGIMEEDVPKIFLPYSRVDEQRNRSVEGSGLGFPIIINLLKLMDSELKLDSVYGQGSTFWFDLRQTVTDDEPVGDIRKRLEAEAKEFEYRPALYAPTARVMVVDDNSMNRTIFVGLLKHTAVQITAVSGGRKCLEEVKRQKYDIIFMDHLMPELDGVETLLRLKSLEGNLSAAAPVIALTANAFSGAEEQYRLFGFDGFLSKPIVPDKLEKMLLEMLPSEKLETPPPDQMIRPAAAPARMSEDLPAVEGVDWDHAALHISDSKLLMSTVKDFYRSIDGTMAELTALAARLDDPEILSNYRTRVHSLKSTAAMVGILTVSEFARVLEDAAKNGQTDRVRILDPILHELLELTRERLRPIMGADGQKEELTDPALLASLLETLRPALQGMDITTADAVMGQIGGFACPPDIQKEIDEIAAQIFALDFDRADAAAAALLTHLEERAME